MSQNTLANPATEKQIGYAQRLHRGAENLDALTPEQQDILRRLKQDGGYVSKDEASYLIGGLLKCKEKPRGDMAKPGYYVKTDGTYLVVVQNRQGNATYAKRLEVTKPPGRRAKARWTYAPGEGREVAHMVPMSLEQAAKFGHLHGVCFVCCRALTDPESVRRGIGPVCAKRFPR